MKRSRLSGSFNVNGSRRVRPTRSFTLREAHRMNIREVAKRAGVSTATVSRVVNGTAPVDARTEKRVRAVIQRSGYYPNTHARTLGTGKSHIYGLIISDIENPFFPELVKCFERMAVEHGYEVLIANTDYQPERMEVCVRRMLERKVDGVAIMTSEMDPELIRMLSGRGIPIVFLDFARSPQDRFCQRTRQSCFRQNAAPGFFGIAEAQETRVQPRLHSRWQPSIRWRLRGDVRDSEATRAADGGVGL
jgi:transcriptional regulator with XRE-family HTH domain